MDTLNLDAFSHGQIVSKLWLCEELEKYIPQDSQVTILGGWYNVLGFMLLTRRPTYYKSIRNIDQDVEAIRIADKITDAWAFGSVKNTTQNANEAFISNGAVVINCSVEHFENNNWFNDLRKGTLVCIQSSDVTDPKEPWLITQPSPTMESFLSKFPVAETLFTGTKRIQYPHFGYNRFMLIGRT